MEVTIYRRYCGYFDVISIYSRYCLLFFDFSLNQLPMPDIMSGSIHIQNIDDISQIYRDILKFVTDKVFNEAVLID